MMVNAVQSFTNLINNEKRNGCLRDLLVHISSHASRELQKLFFDVNKDLLHIDEPLYGTLCFTSLLDNKFYQLNSCGGGKTLLHVLAQMDGMHAIIHVLINFGAKVDVEDDSRMTPIVLAMLYSRYKNFATILSCITNKEALLKRFLYAGSMVNVLELAVVQGKHDYIKVVCSMGFLPDYALHILYYSMAVYSQLNNSYTSCYSSIQDLQKSIQVAICDTVLSNAPTLALGNLLHFISYGVPQEIFYLMLMKSDFLRCADDLRLQFFSNIENLVLKLELNHNSALAYLECIVGYYKDLCGGAVPLGVECVLSAIQKVQDASAMACKLCCQQYRIIKTVGNFSSVVQDPLLFASGSAASLPNSGAQQSCIYAGNGESCLIQLGSFSLPSSRFVVDGVSTASNSEPSVSIL